MNKYTVIYYNGYDNMIVKVEADSIEHAVMIAQQQDKQLNQDVIEEVDVLCVIEGHPVVNAFNFDTDDYTKLD